MLAGNVEGLRRAWDTREPGRAEQVRRSREDAMSSQRVRPQGRSSNIFINYRRENSSGHAGRLFDALNAHFSGRGFMDNHTLEPRGDFAEGVEEGGGRRGGAVGIHR